MFWIHGGGNTSGLKDLYDFDKMVRKHQVVVVRINYRLGPFGWFTHPAIQDLQEGIDKELAKKITTLVKHSKTKVQASIQGESVRITGKKRDDLQQVIQLVKDQNYQVPLQYVNFRD